MPLMLAGYPLMIPPEPGTDPFNPTSTDRTPKPLVNITDWIKKNISFEECIPVNHRAWPGGLLSNHQVSFRSRPHAPQFVEVGTTRYLAGADRYMISFQLASANLVDPIRTAANGEDGTEINPVTLEFWSENQLSGEKFSCAMYLLKIIPLQQIPEEENPNTNNPYLLVLVDDRYWWNASPIPCPDFAIPIYGSGTSPTWTTCFDMVQTALGIDDDQWTVDDIPTQYLAPDPSLNLAGAPIGLVFQALCDNVGLRCVVQLDNSVYVMSVDTSNDIAEADSEANPLRTLRSGGDWFQDEL